MTIYRNSECVTCRRQDRNVEHYRPDAMGDVIVLCEDCARKIVPSRCAAERAVLDAAREWECRMREWDTLAERDTDEVVRTSAAAQDALRAAVAALLAEEVERG